MGIWQKCVVLRPLGKNKAQGHVKIFYLQTGVQAEVFCRMEQKEPVCFFVVSKVYTERLFEGECNRALHIKRSLPIRAEEEVAFLLTDRSGNLLLYGGTEAVSDDPFVLKSRIKGYFPQQRAFGGQQGNRRQPSTGARKERTTETVQQHKPIPPSSQPEICEQDPAEQAEVFGRGETIVGAEEEGSMEPLDRILQRSDPSAHKTGEEPSERPQEETIMPQPRPGRGEAGEEAVLTGQKATPRLGKHRIGRRKNIQKKNTLYSVTQNEMIQPEEGWVWEKMEYADQEGFFYWSGTQYEHATAITQAVAVPGSYAPVAPANLQGFSQYVRGYWVLAQRMSDKEKVLIRQEDMGFLD